MFSVCCLVFVVCDVLLSWSCCRGRCHYGGISEDLFTNLEPQFLPGSLQDGWKEVKMGHFNPFELI